VGTVRFRPLEHARSQHHSSRPVATPLVAQATVTRRSGPSPPPVFHQGKHLVSPSPAPSSPSPPLLHRRRIIQKLTDHPGLKDQEAAPTHPRPGLPPRRDPLARPPPARQRVTPHRYRHYMKEVLVVQATTYPASSLTSHATRRRSSPLSLPIPRRRLGRMSAFLASSHRDDLGVTRTMLATSLREQSRGRTHGRLPTTAGRCAATLEQKDVGKSGLATPFTQTAQLTVCRHLAVGESQSRPTVVVEIAFPRPSNNEGPRRRRLGNIRPITPQSRRSWRRHAHDDTDAGEGAGLRKRL